MGAKRKRAEDYLSLELKLGGWEMASLEGTLRVLFKAVDRKDFSVVLKMTDKNAEAIDEITKKWIRGKPAFKRYVSRLGPEISDIKSRIRALHTRQVGNMGIATFMLQQSYMLSGKRYDLNLASSFVFIKRGTDWRMTLFHQTPL